MMGLCNRRDLPQCEPARVWLTDVQGRFGGDVGGAPVPRRPDAKRDRLALVGMMRRAVLAAPLALTGCDWAVLNPKGFVGVSDVTILIDSVAIMLAIVVPTIVATLAFAWWFRASNTRATYLPGFAYSGRIEMIVWGIPLLVIMLLGGVAWIGSPQLDPAEPLPS